MAGAKASPASANSEEDDGSTEGTRAYNWLPALPPAPTMPQTTPRDRCETKGTNP